MHCLVVDDSVQGRYLLHTLLQRHGFAVEEAHNGAEALMLAHQHIPDLVISDILMPVMDGYALLHEWKTDETLCRIPFIIHTATYTDPKDERLALDLGADAFILKPVEAEPFIARINALMVETKRRESTPVRRPTGEGNVLLKEYNEVLIRKLEQKALQLEQANRELFASESRLRAIFDNEPDCVKVLAADGSLLKKTPAGLSMLGADSLAQVRNQRFYSFIAEEHRTAFVTFCGKVMLGESGIIEYQITDLRGGHCWLETHASPLLDASGTITGLLSITRDTTKRKRAADALRESELKLQKLIEELEGRVEQRTAELELANKELEAFSYSVAHDLRAPLRAISGFSEIVLRENGSTLDQVSNGYLKRIQVNSVRMSELIDDLLSLSRISCKEAQRQDFDFSALVDGAITSLTEAHPGRNVAVTVKPEVRANADPGLMRLVLENLLGNAWKFTAKVSEARIEVGTEQRDGEVIYYVRDNGAGFDMEFAHKLFAPFQRLHGREEFEGTGIGLSIVQRIVSKHGGKAWAESIKGRGATFYFTLS